ncbi:GIY-YIG nuclease family protein [Actibacterium sp. MT2.3-13A]|uniref:GIY-YIG nuclease family protein n=1 Tax=Actibacterium sp. MT2.3-13A TaxID=2828332 RepID=UPI001BA7D754|nr:GIY-YIG nuclease family protein [Actibacterium sp. MT2.3-13A]
MNSTRRAAMAAYRERRQRRGVFAVRHEASGAVWLGTSPDLDMAANRIFFSLRSGGWAGRDLAEAWRAQGGEGFRFEVVEVLDDDLAPLARERLAAARLAHWMVELGARPASPAQRGRQPPI